MGERAPGRPGDRALIALVGCYLMVQPLSTDLYLASLPGLTRTFATSIATVQLTLSVFVVGFGLAQLWTGPLSDRFGRRPVLLGGLVLYCAASLGCALAPSIAALVAGRLFQAVGCCTVVVVARAIVRDAFDPEAGARALSQASTLLALGPIFGPILGAALEVNFGHRAAFALLALLTAALLWVTWAWLGETNRHPDPRALAPRTLLANYRHVLRSRVFVACTFAGAASYAGLFAFISGSPFVLIEVLGVPTRWFGLAYASVVVGYLLGTLLAQRLLRRIGLLRTLRAGASIALAAALLLAGFALLDGARWWPLLGAQFVYFAAHGVLLPGTMAGCIAPFPRHAGAAAGLFGFFMMAAAALIGWWIGASHDGTVLPMTLTTAACGATAFAIVRAGLARAPGFAVP
jgi:DHA1 family bicyclomycin/chloramphenicol resistance-like MFS transporter